MVFTGTPPAGNHLDEECHFDEEKGLAESDAELAGRALIEEARRRHRRRLTAIGITVVVALLLAALLVGVLRRQPSGPAGQGRTQLRPPAGLFSQPTGDVLVFADGLGLDLDHRVAGRQPIAGQRAGDQRWDIVRSGNAVVVGWGDVWATSIATGASRLLGPVVTFVPAAEANAVWLVDYPGGRIGEGTPTLREVTTTGTTVRTELGPPPSDGLPVDGIPGGLAFETASGIALWDAADRRFSRRLGQQAGDIGDEAADTLAWCEGNCDLLHVTNVAGVANGVHRAEGSDRVFSSPQAGQYFTTQALRISPDGRYVAVITTRPGLEASDQKGSLDVLDMRTGRFTVARRSVSAWSTMAWSPDGKSLFFASDDGLGQSEGHPGTGMHLGEFLPHSGRTETARLSITNAEPFVVLPRSEAGAFLARIHRPSRACASEAITPGVPSPPCGPISF
ncbi:MAG TPA: hypothetical protein VN799_10250 [Acidimicrobiales bacterium]|nr:hypothetical protein [Acidimicrobiales bacterium]